MNKSTSFNQILRYALEQDLGPKGDVTSNATISPRQQATAKFIVKDRHGIISGLNIAEQIFKLVDPKISFTPLLRNGDQVKTGDTVATLSGPARSILAGERVSLEFLRRMSGIATKTNLFTQALQKTQTTLLDTRKVMPGFGELDKQAVRDGGGKNHRLNLSEMGLVKNNHIDILNGNIPEAIKLFRKKYPTIPLEIEVRNKKELSDALSNNPDRILLDNMDDNALQNSVSLRNKYFKKTGKNILLEASGNMSLDRIRPVAKTGVDYISVGSLTHSVEAFDISLHIDFTK